MRSRSSKRLALDRGATSHICRHLKRRQPSTSNFVRQACTLATRLASRPLCATAACPRSTLLNSTHYTTPFGAPRRAGLRGARAGAAHIHDIVHRNLCFDALVPGASYRDKYRTSTFLLPFDELAFPRE
eukprot:1858443-Pleurochrysis_carterae.AAC.3